MEKRRQDLPDGKIRFRMMVDGGLAPSGVFWEKTVAAEDAASAQKELDQIAEGLGMPRDPAPAAAAPKVPSAVKGLFRRRYWTS